MHHEWKTNPVVGGRESWRSAPGWHRVADKTRRRRRGLQGRPAKMPDLSYVMYQWFVDARSKISWGITSRFLRSQARSILGAMCLDNVAGDVAPDPPVINARWLQAWRYQWGVSLKKPSNRYKVKRSVLKQRLVIYWSNLVAVRWFSGNDLESTCCMNSSTKKGCT